MRQLLSTQPSGTATALAMPRVGRRPAVLAGARAMVPHLLGVMPFAVVVGIAVTSPGVPRGPAWSTSWLVYGGSAQLVAIDALRRGLSPLLLVVSVLVVNARLALYSTALAPRWAGMSPAGRAVAAYLVVDPSVAVGLDGYRRYGGPRGHVHYLGGAVLLWVAWQLGVVAGIVLGRSVSPALQLDFLAPLYTLSLAVPRLTTGPVRGGAAAAVVVAAAAAVLPLHIGPLTGMVAGCAVAVVLARRAAR